MRKSYCEATKIANDFAQRFIKQRYEIAGSLRRKEKTIGDVDIITSEFLDQIYKRLDRSASLASGGDKKIDIDFKGMRFNIYYAQPHYWGSMLFFLTGPAGYAIAYRRRAKEKGWYLNQYGLFDKNDSLIASKTETEIYKAFGKEYKQPELRGR